MDVVERRQKLMQKIRGRLWENPLITQQEIKQAQIDAASLLALSAPVVLFSAEYTPPPVRTCSRCDHSRTLYHHRDLDEWFCLDHLPGESTSFPIGLHGDEYKAWKALHAAS